MTTSKALARSYPTSKETIMKAYYYMNIKSTLGSVRRERERERESNKINGQT